MYRPLWIEIDLKALRDNFRAIKRRIGNKTGIIATVKQNAYGHGLLQVARELSRMKTDFFGLESIEEAVILRRQNFNEPILILTAILPRFASAFIQYRLTPTIVDINFARALNREAKNKGVIMPGHVKVDTGMGRLGLNCREVFDFVLDLKKLRNIRLEGIYTHFPAADADKAFTKQQIALFAALVEAFKKENIHFKYIHCANSAAIVNFPESYLNLVRPGLILYGIKPAPRAKLAVVPVLSLKTRVIFVKDIAEGATVSYGRTYAAKKKTRIATLAVGYADGYQRILSNRAKVIIKDGLFPVAGRVCMDHTMVDLGGRKDIKAGEEVVLLGKKGKREISAGDLADWAGTIPYEITTCLSSRIPRIYKKIK